MKRISLKIVVCLLLTLTLWGGVNFSFGRSINNISLGVERVEAAPSLIGAIPIIGIPYNAVSLWRDFYKLTHQGKEAPSVGQIIGGSIADTVMTVNGVLLQFIAIPIMSVLFRLSAAMLDNATQFTLSTNIFASTNSGVVTVWVLIRDICNITFIFILLWTAIQTIIGIAGANTKKMIANVIIAALLINFSLFITRILIDAGNILAVNLYNLIQSGSSMVNGVNVSFAGQGLGSILMQAMGMSGITGAASTAASADGVFSVAYGMISYLQLITLVIAFVVFVYAMLLMVARIVVLIFLAALSPIGFMGNVLPKVQEYSKMWRENLYGQVMIAPIFLLFVYLVIKVSTAFDNLAPTGTLAAARGLDDTANSAQYLAYFKYVMIITLLIVAVKTTKKMTGVVGSAIEGFAKAAAGIAIGAVTGGVAFAGRRLIGGAGAGAVMGNEKLANMASDKNKNFATKFAARQLIKGAEKTSKATFDARNTGVFKTATGFIGDQTGLKVDYNKGISIKKGGYEGMVKERVKEEEEFTKNFENVKFSATKLEDERAEMRSKAAEKRTEFRTAKTTLGTLTDPDDIRKKKAEISKLESELTSLEGMTGTDEKSTRNLTAELQKRIKERYADVAEKGIVNTILGANKKAAAAIRKSVRGKSDADEVIERMKKITGEAEEKPKEEKPAEPKEEKKEESKPEK